MRLQQQQILLLIWCFFVRTVNTTTGSGHEDLNQDENVTDRSMDDIHFGSRNLNIARESDNIDLIRVEKMIETKLNDIVQLIENKPDLDKQRVDKRDVTTERSFRALEARLDQLDSKLNTLLAEQSKLNSAPSGTDQHGIDPNSMEWSALLNKVNKVHNIHEETYRICKEALQEESSRNSHNKKGHKNSSGHNKNREERHEGIDIVQHRVPVNSSTEIVNRDDLASSELNSEIGNIQNVLHSMINQTLDRNLAIVRKIVAEELNFIGYFAEEKYKVEQEVNDKVTNLAKELLETNGQIWTALVEIRNNQTNDRDLLNLLDDKITNIIEKDRRSDNQNWDLAPPETGQTQNSVTATIDNQTLIQIMDGYFEKIQLWLNNQNITTTTIVTEKCPNKSVSTHVESPITHSQTDLGPLTLGQSTTTDIRYSSRPSIEILSDTLFPDQRNCSYRFYYMHLDSCYKLWRSGNTCSGHYQISIRNSIWFRNVYCDMEDNGGGWTVILRNGKYKPIEISESGFLGYLSMNLDLMYKFTNPTTIDYLSDQTQPVSTLLQVDLEDVQGNYRSFVYSGFRIGSASDDYRFYVEKVIATSKSRWLEMYSTESEFRLASELLRLNGTRYWFTTFDMYEQQCQPEVQSDWWHKIENQKPTKKVILNGCQFDAPVQIFPPFESFKNMAPYWQGWNDLKYVTMKIKPQFHTEPTNEMERERERDFHENIWQRMDYDFF